MGIQAALALPLGELSPQVTERGLQQFLNGKINLFAYTTKIPVNILIGKSQNLQTKSLQKLRALSIINHPLRFIMLRSIQFNNQFGRCAVKVHDKPADNPLLVNFYRISAEKEIPKLTFMGCHLSSKLPGIFQLGVVFWDGHNLPSPASQLLGHLSQRERKVYTLSGLAVARPPLPRGEARIRPDW